MSTCNDRARLPCNERDCARTCWRLQIVLSCVFLCQYVFALSIGPGVVSACADDCEDLGPLRSWKNTCTDSTSPPNPSNYYYFSTIALNISTCCQIPPHHQAAFVILVSPAQVSYLTFYCRGTLRSFTQRLH